MANLKDKLSNNVPGRYYVDSQCIQCGNCVMVASENFWIEGDEMARVIKQPENEDEESRCKDAKEICPVEAIGDDGE